MKTIFLTVVLSLLLGSTALADWAEDFTATAAKSGTDLAVVEALKVGVSPVDIVKLTQQAEGFAPAAVMKALYCADLNGSLVQSVASEAGVSSSDVAAGYKQSVGQCGPAAGLNADPFSQTRNVATGGTPVSGGGQPPAVIPPPIDGGVVVPPPSASSDRFN